MKPLIYLFTWFILLAACRGDYEKQATVKSPQEVAYLTPEVACGTVQFVDGCSPKLDTLIKFGLALIHHMTFDDAEYTFSQVIKMDPDCFWGHWGKAMTYIHPLWPDEPGDEKMKLGWVLAQRALNLAKNDRERLYAQALAAYYKDGKQKTEHERLVAYQEGWRQASELLPDDIEARLFHGLSRLSTVAPTDKSYTIQKEVGMMAEKVLEEIPDHPGGFHYAIHAYDFPPLAHHAIRVAQDYGKIAPEIPHALHMPSHIFTRLGHWDESIHWNERSAAAASKFPVDGQVSFHYFHALDYLVYAHLQRAESDKAEAILNKLDTIKAPVQANIATAYALASIPARIALENRKWTEAANTDLRYSSHFPWNKFPHFEAIVHFARGIGAARSGQVETVGQALDKLDSLQNLLGNAPATRYWANQIEIQKTAVKSWQTFSQGNRDQALKIMQTAAELEAATEKSPITPGELLPVREMLGDMLLEMNQPSKALESYKLSLVRNPNRFNTLYGAGKAAELAGNKAEAKMFYQDLLNLGGKNAPNKEQILHASKIVNEA